MSGRDHQSNARAAIAGVGVAGLTGLATLLVTAPAADAAPTPNVATDTSTPAAGETTSPTARDEVAPNYGYKKLRIGVQQKDGSYVPPTSSTVGTKITVTQSGGSSTSTTPSVLTCETAAGSATEDDDPSASFCVFNASPLQARIASVGRKAKAVRGPVAGNPPINQAYFVEPGATVTIKQTSVRPGYVADPASPITVTPCTVDSNEVPICDAEQIVLENGGLPPAATDDSARTKQGTPVTIAIAPNDTPKAPITGVKITGNPDHGTARLISAESDDPEPTTTSSSATPSLATVTLELRRPAGSRSLAAVTSYKAIYTPADGFTGVDTFDYAITTANGTARATVTVTVTGSAASPSDTSGDDVSADTDDRNDLADTGTQSGELVTYGLGLLVAGAGAVAVGRQRRRGRHAR